MMLYGKINELFALCLLHGSSGISFSFITVF